MRATPRPVRRLPRRWLREIGLVWYGGWSRLQPRLWILFLALTVLLAGVWVVDNADKALAAGIHVDNARATAVAAFISNHSDLELCVPLSVTLWLVGAMSNRARWRRLGLACLMATVLAGILTQGIKRIPGRPRPLRSGDVATSIRIFVGPSRLAKFHSFPSGHTSTSSATAVSLVAASPVMAVPGVIYVASVGWSRIQLRAHYPLDVAGGGFIGLLCGTCFASTVPGSVIRLRRRKRPRRPNRQDGMNSSCCKGSKGC
jgi:undecaprenyl-diphosphatase